MSTMLNGCLADTDYFEVTAKSGHEYAVWVTTPAGYSDGTAPLPLVYVTDGNFAVGQTAPLIVVQSDPYLAIAPYIQVTIGYAGDEAADWARLRNRDLVPPGEPVSSEVLKTLEASLAAGAMSREYMDAYVQELRDSHADAFLSFLTDELHPRLRAELRVSDTGHGLFGYSYGGLFSLYAWLSRPDFFSTVGAGSPGVIDADSQVFKLLAELPEPSADADIPKLHVTLNEAEVLGAIPVYRALARHCLELLEQLHARGLSSAVTNAMLQQTHVTGLQASFLSYLRCCHGR
jgi:predicted alpha/beta superfamily hydrolase